MRTGTVEGPPAPIRGRGTIVEGDEYVRFTKPFWEGIANGTVTVAYRGWKSPTVVAGRPYRTGGGRIEVLAVARIEEQAVTLADAKKAGYSSVGEVLDNIRTDEDRELYRVEFRRLDEPDPREELANDDNLSSADIDEIQTKLARLDTAGKDGPWTDQALRLIAEHPGRRAPDLAEMVGRETKPFKLDVRKLKKPWADHEPQNRLPAFAAGLGIPTSSTWRRYLSL